MFWLIVDHFCCGVVFVVTFIGNNSKFKRNQKNLKSKNPKISTKKFKISKKKFKKLKKIKKSIKNKENTKFFENGQKI